MRGELIDQRLLVGFVVRFLQLGVDRLRCRDGGRHCGRRAAHRRCGPPRRRRGHYGHRRACGIVGPQNRRPHDARDTDLRVGAASSAVCASLRILRISPKKRWYSDRAVARSLFHPCEKTNTSVMPCDSTSATNRSIAPGRLAVPSLLNSSDPKRKAVNVSGMPVPLLR